MKSTNTISILTLIMIAAGFTALYIKDNSADTDKELLNAIALLTQNVEQVNQQLAYTSSSVVNDSTGQPDALATNNSTATLNTTGGGRLNISVPSLRQDLSKGAPDMIIISPTPEQNLIYEGLKARLDDPSYSESLSLMELKTHPDMQQLDTTMQMLILNKAVKKFNDGEISKEVFLAGMKSTKLNE